MTTAEEYEGASAAMELAQAPGPENEVPQLSNLVRRELEIREQLLELRRQQQLVEQKAAQAQAAEEQRVRQFDALQESKRAIEDRRRIAERDEIAKKQSELADKERQRDARSFLREQYAVEPENETTIYLATGIVRFKYESKAIPFARLSVSGGSIFANEEGTRIIKQPYVCDSEGRYYFFLRRGTYRTTVHEANGILNKTTLPVEVPKSPSFLGRRQPEVSVFRKYHGRWVGVERLPYGR